MLKLMDYFHTEILGRSFPLNFMTDMETIATLYGLLAMADGPKSPAGTFDVKTPQKFKFSPILAMNKSRKHPDECFLDSGINKPFAVNKEILIFSRPIGFHELHRSN